MKTTASLVAFAASAAAQQFVLYANADKEASQRIDPIITPGKLSGHVHDILGAGSFAPELSFDSLQDTDCTTVGDADGNGNAEDNSAYWHPALFAKKSDGSGYMKIPTVSHKMYYRKPAATKYREPFEFPQGWAMIAGDPFLRAANTNTTGITGWKCFGTGAAEGEDGGFPTITGPCDAYPGFMGTLHFPHCWNGEDYNPEDPTAHTAYPEGDVQSGNCPSSHPTAVPHIFMENNFDLTEETLSQIDVSTLTLAQGDPTGFGWHADMFNGWIDGALPRLFESCPQGEWGNHDIGTCPTFKKYTKSPSSCKLKKYFDEDVQEPGKNLIGCNPVSTQNPAPKLDVAALGSAILDCAAGLIDDLTDGLIGGGEDDGHSSTAAAISATSYAAPSYVAPAPTTPASSTTFLTTTTPPAALPSYGGWGTAAVEEEDDDDEYEYVTEWVDVVETATVYAKRDSGRHNHMNAHKRRNF